jgi:hypothetical protein
MQYCNKKNSRVRSFRTKDPKPRDIILANHITSCPVQHHAQRNCAQNLLNLSTLHEDLQMYQYEELLS